MPMLVQGGPHDNVDEHPEPRGDKHRLRLDHEVLVDYPGS